MPRWAMARTVMRVEQKSVRAARERFRSMEWSVSPAAVAVLGVGGSGMSGWRGLGECLAGAVVLLHLLDEEDLVAGGVLVALFAVTVEAESVAGGDVGGGAGEGVGFAVGGAELEAGGGVEDAALEGVVRLLDLVDGDDGDHDDSGDGCDSADDLAFAGADAVVAGVAGAAGGAAADEEGEDQGKGCGRTQTHEVPPGVRNAGP